MQEAPKWQPSEEDLGSKFPYILTPRQAGGVMTRLLMQGGLSSRKAIQLVFSEEIARRLETVDTLEGNVHRAATRGLEKIGRGLEKVTRERRGGTNATLPLTDEELVSLGIVPDRTPKSHTLYQTLNRDFADRTVKDIQEAILPKKIKPAVVQPAPVDAQPAPQPEVTLVEKKPSPARLPITALEPVVLPRPDTVSPEALQATIQQLAVILPDASLRAASGDQLAYVATLVARFQAESLQMPNEADFLQRDDYQLKARLVKQGLDAITAGIALGDPTFNIPTKVARAINNLSFLVGRLLGKDFVKNILSQLPDLQQQVLCAKMSTNLKEILYYPDIDWCSEVQMAAYLEGVAYFRNPKDFKKLHWDEIATIPEENVDRLSVLPQACALRANLNVCAVIDTILENKDKKSNDAARDFFLALIDIAEQGEHLEELEEFFQQHPATTRLAGRCHTRRLYH